MHVKILIRDADAGLVTSAKSGTAMRDNVEVGVELRGGSIAGRLRQLFDDLESNGALARL